MRQCRIFDDLGRRDTILFGLLCLLYGVFSDSHLLTPAPEKTVSLVIGGETKKKTIGISNDLPLFSQTQSTVFFAGS
eukprot:NODE_3356_length_783_cov_32.768392_g2805_i0.p2 GENE.NODE_3356_length_783_cov_32.768392_g2805_i0~~NODE_3356_length_783_cov_32.768392_g2805_i0.p2  ORF type:complete len:77 (+),score=4.62 NODE_3356_length_783_cov_32.768392_g2805_i0:398-628(+)